MLSLLELIAGIVISIIGIAIGTFLYEILHSKKRREDE